MVIKVVAMAGRHGDHFKALMQVPDLFLVKNIMLVVKMFDQEACAVNCLSGELNHRAEEQVCWLAVVIRFTRLGDAPSPPLR